MLKTASITGLLAVALGAFGAHGLSQTLADYGTIEVWKTASFYHLVHAVVLLVVALALPRALWSFRCFLAGIIIFSGSLYIYAFTGMKWLGMITPIGGLALMAGWLLLAFKPKA